ncbi:MAG: 3-dehydroquinate synthase [candidate division Zixibacteria bacterium]|nr:3-dehydroquinate synthase [candidate division Zixibacteria bacterium]MDH3935806.1 3-dehydroquinate synthase [candidate division Zixibacteria bacterium]MDH4034781.1 3-dehydroquinate synthase [candidate division Zixibacteria bacterium]
MPDLRVRVSSGQYPIAVVSKKPDRLRTLLAKACTSDRLFVFYDAQFYALHAASLRKSLTAPGRRLIELVLPSGEKTKSSATLEKVYSFLLAEKISRDDFVLAVGGGVTSDLIGYAAATTLRGIRWGVVPTTLLGMVDAAIGGKTGINHRQGKNLIGAFWHPRFVYVDTWWTNTLAARQMMAGMGEVVKYAGLTGQPMLKLTEGWVQSSSRLSQPVLTKLVKYSVACKADIVTRDERERNVRMFLNLGHTVGHAIEKAAGYGRLLHGEAVILGLWAAIELSCSLKQSRRRYLDGYRRNIECLVRRLPKVKLQSKKIAEAMSLDKKRRGDDIRFVLLDRPGKPFIADNVPGRTIRAVIERSLTMYDRLGGRDA